MKLLTAFLLSIFCTATGAQTILNPFKSLEQRHAFAEIFETHDGVKWFIDLRTFGIFQGTKPRLTAHFSSFPDKIGEPVMAMISLDSCPNGGLMAVFKLSQAGNSAAEPKFFEWKALEEGKNAKVFDAVGFSLCVTYSEFLKSAQPNPPSVPAPQQKRSGSGMI